MTVELAEHVQYNYSGSLQSIEELEGNCSQLLAQKHHPAPTPGPGGSCARALKHRQEAGWAVLRKLGVVL